MEKEEVKSQTKCGSLLSRAQEKTIASKLGLSFVVFVDAVAVCDNSTHQMKLNRSPLGHAKHHNPLRSVLGST